MILGQIPNSFLSKPTRPAANINRPLKAPSPPLGQPGRGEEKGDTLSGRLVQNQIDCLPVRDELLKVSLIGGLEVVQVGLRRNVKASEGVTQYPAARYCIRLPWRCRIFYT